MFPKPGHVELFLSLLTMTSLAYTSVFVLVLGINSVVDVDAATSNVTYRPWRNIPIGVRERTKKMGEIWRNSSQDMVARGQIRDLIERLDVRVDDNPQYSIVIFCYESRLVYHFLLKNSMR